MTSIETLLEERARDWVADAPQPPPLSDLVARVTSARRGTSRWLMPALAAATVAVVAALAMVIVAANRPDGTSTPPGSSSGLTAAQRTLAIRVALREVSGANPDAAGPIRPLTTWPSYVDTVAATVLPREQAMQQLDGHHIYGSVTPRRALVVRLTGRFALVTTGPPGSGNATGNVITAVVSLRTGQITGAGITRQSSPPVLPNQTLLYQR